MIRELELSGPLLTSEEGTGTEGVVQSPVASESSNRAFVMPP